MYRMVYMTLSGSEAELSKFLQEIKSKDLLSKPIQFGLKFINEFKSSNYYKILDYMVIYVKLT
jgi:hypothetical protein